MDETLKKEDIAEAIATALDARRSIPEEQHHEHHGYVQHLINESRRKKEFWRDIKKRIYGWGAIVFITAIGAMFYDWIITFIRKVGGE